MRFFRSLVTILYLCIYIVIGAILITVSLDLVPVVKITSYIEYAFANNTIRLITGVIGILFIGIGIISSKISFAKIQRSKTIAFENPDGQVVISLIAIEDYIKKIVKQLPQVRDLKSTVTANKRGITVVSRASLFADSNIPEVTEKIQSIIKSKLLDMLGIEESIKIKVEIAKFLTRGGKDEAEDNDDSSSRHMPFRGME